MSCCGQKRQALSQTRASQGRPAATPGPSAPRRKSSSVEAALMAFLMRRARSANPR